MSTPTEPEIVSKSSESNQNENQESNVPPTSKTALPPTQLLKFEMLSRFEVFDIFGRQDSDYTVIEHAVRIEQQTTLSKLVFAHLQALKRPPLPLTLDEFQDIWRILILKRVQDVYEKERSQRHNDFVRIDRGIMAPAPLADLLHSLGRYTSRNGHVHDIVPPAKAATAPKWWTPNSEAIAKWNLMCRRFNNYYTFKEFPSNYNFECSPLMLLKTQITNDKIQVKSFTPDAQMTDSLIVMANDNLFDDHAYITFNNCSLCFGPTLSQTAIRLDYVRSYDIGK